MDVSTAGRLLHAAGKTLAKALCFMTATSVVAAAPTSVDYERAMRFMSANALDEYILNGQLRYQWLGGSERERFYYLRRTANGKEFVLVDARTASRRPAFDHGALARALSDATGVAVDPTNLPFDWIEFADGGMRVAEFDSDKKRWRCVLGGACTSVVSRAPAEGVISPDGRWSVIRKEANVWLRSLQDGVEQQLTTDGTPDFGYGGRDELPQMLRREPPLTAALWSPDSRRVLVEKLDTRGERPYYFLQHAPEDGSLRPKLFAQTVDLPADSPGKRCGERVESLAIFEITSSKRVDVRHPSFECTMLGWWEEIFWSTDGRTVFAMPREESLKTLQLLEVDADSGRVRRLIEETAATYVDAVAGSAGAGRFSFLSSGDVLWFSERSDWSHLYRYDRDGRLKNPVTAGEWRVQEIVRVDEARQRVYFMAQGREPGEDPYQQHLYVVNLDGSDLRLLTPGNAHHQVDTATGFSPSGRYFIEIYSRPDLAPVTVLRDRSGKQILHLETADLSRLEASGFTRPEPFQVLAADGKTPIHGNVFRPATLDTERRYPVIDVIYPGPHSYRSRKSFLGAVRDEAQGLAELGFIVVTIDGRGTAGRSKSFHDVSYGNMQQAGNLEDHIAGIRQLAKRYPYMDLDRVGISGWSAGGFAATRALLDHPQFYKVATSTAGDHDVRMDVGWATIYQGPFDEERWAPLVNARLASKLQGKLLLIQGDLDHAVHPAVNMQFIAALIKANKNFDMLVVPNGDHMVHFDPYVIRRRMDYFVRHLMGVEPPDGHEIAATSR